MAIVYIKSLKSKSIFYKIFNILSVKIVEQKEIIYLPLDSHSSTNKIKKVILKLCKYLVKKNINNVVIEQELIEIDCIRKILNENHINIIEGVLIKKILAYKSIRQILYYKNKEIELSEITLLIKENDEINRYIINLIAKDVKKLNIITENTRKFNKIADYLYNEIGIIVTVTNNFKLNIKGSDIIVNIDFQEELLNELNIPNNAVIINIPHNINIKSKSFAGINIRSFEINIPDKYKIKGFDNLSVYEANMYRKPYVQIIEQIKKDMMQINNLIGVNGIINSNEFIKI